MKNPRIIFVTGIPAAGKTTVARALARELGCTLVDYDDVRRLFGPVNTNPESGKAAYKALMNVAHFWAEKRPDETVIFTIPMIVPERQLLLQNFCSMYQQVAILAVQMSDNSDEKIIERLERRRVAGYTGGVNTLGQFRRAQGTAVPMPLAHKSIDTSIHSIAECVAEALEYIR